MGKKHSDRPMSGTIGTMEPLTTRQYVRHGLVTMAKIEFADLNSSGLDGASELWEVLAELDTLRDQYRASLDKKSQRVVRRIDKFKRQHNL